MRFVYGYGFSWAKAVCEAPYTRCLAQRESARRLTPDARFMTSLVALWAMYEPISARPWFGFDVGVGYGFAIQCSMPIVWMDQGKDS